MKNEKTIEKIKAAAADIVAEWSETREDFEWDFKSPLAQDAWRRGWTQIKESVRAAECECGLIKGAALSELCKVAEQMFAAAFGIGAHVFISWWRKDSEGENEETDFDGAEWGELACDGVCDLYPANDKDYQAKIDRGRILMLDLAEMVHMPHGESDRDGRQEWLWLRWAN